MSSNYLISLGDIELRAEMALMIVILVFFGGLSTALLVRTPALASDPRWAAGGIVTGALAGMYMYYRTSRRAT